SPARCDAAEGGRAVSCFELFPPSAGPSTARVRPLGSGGRVVPGPFWTATSVCGLRCGSSHFEPPDRELSDHEGRHKCLLPSPDPRKCQARSRRLPVAQTALGTANTSARAPI